MNIVHFIKREEGVTLAEICTYTRQRHANHSLLNRTLQQTEESIKKHKIHINVVTPLLVLGPGALEAGEVEAGELAPRRGVVTRS